MLAVNTQQRPDGRTGGTHGNDARNMNCKLCEHPFPSLMFQHKRTRLRTEREVEDNDVVFPLSDSHRLSPDQHRIIHQLFAIPKPLPEQDHFRTNRTTDRIHSNGWNQGQRNGIAHDILDRSTA